MKISLGYNAVPSGVEEQVRAVFRSGQFSPGVKVREFERAWSSLRGARYAIFVNSGTDALRLSLLAMKEKYRWADGSKVAVPSLTFPATVNVVLQAKLTPWFVDVGMLDYCMNPDNLERRLPENREDWPVCMIPVHLFGQACDSRLYDVANKYGMHVLEDSCETVGNVLSGDVSCYSTYMAHHVTTGVGGFAVTDDFELSGLIRSYANHGRDMLYIPGDHGMKQGQGRELLKRRFKFDRVGYSSRATEFEAVLGLSQMGGLEENLTRRYQTAQRLWTALLVYSDDLLLPTPLPGRRHTYLMFPIVIRERSTIDKWDLCQHLEDGGIETREMMPITNQRCYKEFVNESDFSVAEWINRNGFYIPCHPGVGEAETAHIVSTFASFFESVSLDKVVNVL